MAMPLFLRLGPASLPAFLLSRGWERAFSVPARLGRPTTVGPPGSWGPALGWGWLARWAQKRSLGPSPAACADAPFLTKAPHLYRPRPAAALKAATVQPPAPRLEMGRRVLRRKRRGPAGAGFAEGAVMSRNFSMCSTGGGLSELLWVQGCSDSLALSWLKQERKCELTEKPRIELAEGAAGSR